MARIRSIKPEFWTDTKIVNLPFETRLFFQGLWTFADDCGHIENEPLQLKLRILPADDVDASDLIDQLVEAGLIVRLSGCLLITGFEKHQRVDRRAGCRFDESHRIPPNPHDGREGKGREGKGVEGSKNTSSASQIDVLFEGFWKIYPERNSKKLYKAKAVRAFKRLSKTKRDRALVAVGHYRNACDQNLTLAKDAFRWLGDEAFEDWQTPARASPNGNLTGMNKHRGINELWERDE
jgi:hypothetical protein